MTLLIRIVRAHHLSREWLYRWRGNRLVQWKGGRKGCDIGIGSTVRMSGNVDTRYCWHRSVELVYPCVDARSWSAIRIQGYPVAGRRTCNRMPNLLFRDGDEQRFTKARRYLSETSVGNRYPNSQGRNLPEGISQSRRKFRPLHRHAPRQLAVSWTYLSFCYRPFTCEILIGSTARRCVLAPP
jgi:hypothetical protein